MEPTDVPQTPPPPAQQDPSDRIERQPSDADGYDAVVKADRKKRKLTFGPDTIKVAKPNNILIDIYGVITSWEFVSSLKTYARDNLAAYVRDNWRTKLVKLSVARIREQAKVDRLAGVEVPEILEDGDQNEAAVIESAVVSLQWQYDQKHKTTKVIVLFVVSNLCHQVVLPSTFFVYFDFVLLFSPRRLNSTQCAPTFGRKLTTKDI